MALPHAIPHIITEDKSLFDIVLVRNKYGITWNKEGDIVYTAFCLIGGKDERNFHLRSLMFIAQILQDKNFKEKPPPPLFGARGQEALSVRTPLPLTVLWIGYNRFPLFRRALQTFLSQWIDYKKFHIVEYGIAIQELYDGETIDKDGYTAYLPTLV